MVARTCSLPISSVKNHNIGGIPIEMVNIEVYFVPFCWIRVGTHKSLEDTKELLWNEGRWKRHKKLSVTILNWVLWLQTQHWEELEWELYGDSVSALASWYLLMVIIWLY